jgi:hypothetical protein
VAYLGVRRLDGWSVDDTATCFGVIAAWFAFNGLVAIALTYCSPGERRWRRQGSEPVDRRRSRHPSEGETTILSVLKAT